MAESQSHVLQPGDRLQFLNEGEAAIRVRIVTACDTETVSTLDPGARVEVTVGHQSATVYLLNVDEGYTGLHVVRWGTLARLRSSAGLTRAAPQEDAMTT